MVAICYEKFHSDLVVDKSFHNLYSTNEIVARIRNK